MLTAEHAVMQNEALLALTLLASMRLADAEGYLLQAKIGDKLVRLINDFGPSLGCEMVQNIFLLVNQLAISGKIFGLLYLLLINIILKYTGLSNWSVSLFAGTSDLFVPMIYIRVSNLVFNTLPFGICFANSFLSLQIWNVIPSFPCTHISELQNPNLIHEILNVHINVQFTADPY
jgi:hypothetical protein